MKISNDCFIEQAGDMTIFYKKTKRPVFLFVDNYIFANQNHPNVKETLQSPEATEFINSAINIIYVSEKDIQDFGIKKYKELDNIELNEKEKNQEDAISKFLFAKNLENLINE